MHFPASLRRAFNYHTTISKFPLNRFNNKAIFNYFAMVSSKGKPTDPKLREEAKEGMLNHPRMRPKFGCHKSHFLLMHAQNRCKADAKQRRRWKGSDGRLEGKSWIQSCIARRCIAFYTRIASIIPKRHNIYPVHCSLTH